MRDQEPLDTQDERRFEQVLVALDRRPVRLPRALRASVMARIRAERRPSSWRRTWNWLAAPRLSPVVTALAVAAGIAVVMLLRPPPAAQDEGAAAVANVPVRLIFLAPNATSVAVTGDFASWDPKGIPLVGPHADGVWSVQLELPPGLHHYVFIVNGSEWFPDPNAASQVDDGFGQKNSLLLVPARRTS